MSSTTAERVRAWRELQAYMAAHPELMARIVAEREQRWSAYAQAGLSRREFLDDEIEKLERELHELERAVLTRRGH
jgi:hypothetical protein